MPALAVLDPAPVMAGLVPRMPGPSPGMTTCNAARMQPPPAQVFAFPRRDTPGLY